VSCKRFLLLWLGFSPSFVFADPAVEAHIKKLLDTYGSYRTDDSNREAIEKALAEFK
jgi:hypothetical protein